MHCDAVYGHRSQGRKKYADDSTIDGVSMDATRADLPENCRTGRVSRYSDGVSGIVRIL